MKEKLHTSDHILFGVLEKKFAIKSTAMEFKDDSCRVDYECMQDLRHLKDEIEKEVNEVIQKELEVVSYSMPREKAKEIVDVSLVPESIKKIKIYEIKGLNKIACAGPHVNNTKEIGCFKIIKIEKKGKNRYSVKYQVN